MHTRYKARTRGTPEQQARFRSGDVGSAAGSAGPECGQTPADAGVSAAQIVHPHASGEPKIREHWQAGSLARTAELLVPGRVGHLHALLVPQAEGRWLLGKGQVRVVSRLVARGSLPELRLGDAFETAGDGETVTWVLTELSDVPARVSYTQFIQSRGMTLLGHLDVQLRPFDDTATEIDIAYRWTPMLLGSVCRLGHYNERWFREFIRHLTGVAQASGHA